MFQNLNGLAVHERERAADTRKDRAHAPFRRHPVPGRDDLAVSRRFLALGQDRGCRDCKSPMQPLQNEMQRAEQGIMIWDDLDSKQMKVSDDNTKNLIRMHAAAGLQLLLRCIPLHPGRVDGDGFRAPVGREPASND